MVGRFFREHKPQLKRHVLEEEDGGTGAEEVVSFIDLPPNNLSKPEKGILKKHGGYGIVIKIVVTTSGLDEPRYPVKSS